MIDQNSPVGRFIQAGGDVCLGVIVTGTTALMALGSLQSAPAEVQALLPVMDAGAALLLGCRIGERDTKRVARKARRDTRPQP